MKFLKNAFVVGVLAVSAAVSATVTLAQSLPDARPQSLDATDLSAWLDGRVPYALKAGDIAGAVVVVVKDGKVLLQKGYGLADVAANTSMDPDKTVVRLGSTSKLFTWTAVMQLVQQGRLDLDRNVNDYLDFKIDERFGKPITVRHLMNHRAGFEEGLKDLLAYDPAHVQSTEQYLKRHPRPMLFAPGEVPAYSNYGVALAGYIVQRISGEPFEVYVDRHIFQPLGMRHTTMAQPVPPALAPLLAKGYRTASDPQPSPFEYAITAPAGSGSATAADMARFMLAHLQQGSLDGKPVLDPATTARMHSRSERSEPGFAAMAHGFFSFKQNGRDVIGHGGDTIVFHSELNLLPKEGVGIFFSFNSVGRDAAVYGARQELFDGFMDRYFPATAQKEAPTLATAGADAQRIVGRYQSSRRVENSFLSALYLLDQTVITVNGDGTINAPGGPRAGTVKFREVAPLRWRKVGGTQELLLTEVNGVKTVVDSDNPISVLQEASWFRSAPLTLTVLSLSSLVMLGTLVGWPLGALMRRADRAMSGSSSELRRLRSQQRLAVAVALVWLLAWCALIKPVLGLELGVYNSSIDWLVASLQLCGVLLLLAAGFASWAAWRMFRIDASGFARAWGLALALALWGLLWVGVLGQLTSVNLNY